MPRHRTARRGRRRKRRTDGSSIKSASGARLSGLTMAPNQAALRRERMQSLNQHNAKASAQRRRTE